MSRSWGLASCGWTAAVLVFLVVGLMILPAGVAAAGGAKTVTVTLSSDGAVVAAASDAAGAPVAGLSLTMLARSNAGSIIGPRPLAAEAQHPGRYASGPSALPAGTWTVTVSEAGGTRTTVVLTSSGPPAVAKPNPRRPQPTATVAGKLVVQRSSRTGTFLGVGAVALAVCILAVVVLANRGGLTRNGGSARRSRQAAKRRRTAGPGLRMRP